MGPSWYWMPGIFEHVFKRYVQRLGSVSDYPGRYVGTVRFTLLQLSVIPWDHPRHRRLHAAAACLTLPPPATRSHCPRYSATAAAIARVKLPPPPLHASLCHHLCSYVLRPAHTAFSRLILPSTASNPAPFSRLVDNASLQIQPDSNRILQLDVAGPGVSLPFSAAVCSCIAAKLMLSGPFPWCI